MNIGMLSQWFDPEPGPAAVPGIFGREFVRQGHEVSVLTGFPNYPTGRIFEGYRQRIRSTAMQDGMRVTRVPLVPSHDRSIAGRVANYASFAASSSTLGTSALREVDAIWVYNSPVTVAAPLISHSRWGKKKYFLHVQDLWPDSLFESGMFRGGALKLPVKWAIERLVAGMENRAATIGVISPSVKDIILDRNPRLQPDRIIYVPNPTDETLFVPLSEQKIDMPSFPWSDRFAIMYAGAVGDVQGLDTVVEAVALLPPTSPVHLVIVGDGIAGGRLRDRVASMNMRNVTFVGRVPKESIPTFMKSARAHLVSLGTERFLRYTTPSKIPSLLASQVPLLGQISGDGADMIMRSGAGIVTTPGDARQLADAMTAMSEMSVRSLDRLAQSGRDYYTKYLSAESSAAKILATFESNTSDGK